ncbi:DNA recombination protein RmuC [Glaciecola sp. XM2]|uniref:DNA recombination protein RmuC n=1 Tax=Glaciecola sp. XM2 TaxID=1914931 RepID=UPI0020327C26|nr:DNA recombination protein RmuC [Glaciecola sp. XM2]
MPMYVPILTAVFVGLVVLILVVFINKRHQESLHKQSLEFQQAQQALQYELALEQRSVSQLQQQHQQAEQQHGAQQLKFQQQLSQYQEKLYESERKLGESRQQALQLEDAKQQLERLKQEFNELQSAYSQLQAKNEATLASVAQERRGFDEKLSLLENAENKLNTQFENLANKIFEQKSEKFTKTSETGINQILSPLKQQIDDFKRQITEQYTREGQERASLKTEILGLKELNKQITEEAAALTNALKGDNKQQGNWGELVLERILTESGLRNGHEYEVQKSVTNDDGKRLQPDVVIHLPNEKDIVVDSKVSLIAHEKVVNAQSKEDRQRALKEHVASMKGHIKGLSKKDYQDLPGVKSLDYVLMFVPIESAFYNAVEAEPELIKLALDNQIMLVSPTNLLVALRTINNIWQYEYQNQNAKIIADKAAKMYDKLANFVGDMEKIGKNVDTLSNTYEAAMNKLSTGRGNLLRQAQGFKELGVTSTKQLDAKYLQDNDNQE